MNPEVEAAIVEGQSTSEVFTCVTELERRDGVWIPAAYLAACTKVGVEVGAHSVHCPPNCGGHVLCRPCFELTKNGGVLR